MSVRKPIIGAVLFLTACAAIGWFIPHPTQFLPANGSFVYPDSSDTTASVLSVGEELEYHVSYSFFSVGTIRFRIVDKRIDRGRTIYTAQTNIDSNPSLSWLTDVHVRFFGDMDQRVFSYSWVGEDSSSKSVDVRTMNFDYDNRKLYFSSGTRFPDGREEVRERDTVPIQSQCQDGMSLFFYARQHCREHRQEHVPTFIENKQESTLIAFLDQREPAEIDAVDYPVDAVHFVGRADFVGVYGLTGGFEGWFSNDEARIPLVARMKVFLGSIKVQLKSWKHDSWQPPVYVEPK